MDLKDIMPGLKILHIVDHATRYSQATVVTNKSAPEIVKHIFDLWIRVFGCPEKILSDNGGEFNNKELLDLCDKCNLRVLTTAAESPWSNGLAEKHNGILGQMVEKMLDDEPLDPKLAVHWAVAAKNSLTTVYGFSPNTLVFGRDPCIPTTMENTIAANDPQFYSDLVKDNLNALHKARSAFIHQESSEKLSRALNRQTRTYSDRIYLNGDEVFYKRDHSSRWQGPAKVLGKDSSQILIKHGGSYLRVHPCRLLPVNKSVRNDLSGQAHQKSCSLQTEVDAKSDYSEDEAEINKNQNPESHSTPSTEAAIGSTENPENKEDLTNRETVPYQEQEGSEEHTLRECGPRAYQAKPVINNDKTAAVVTPTTNTGNPKQVPKKNQVISYRLYGESEPRRATCLGRAGKASTGSWHYINVHDHESNSEHCLSVKDDMASWKVEPSDTLMAVDENIFSVPKQTELNKWKKMNVYKEVEDVGQRRISTRWVCTERLKAGQIEAKARLCARGCEDPDDVATDSPTCERDNVRILLSIAASSGWDINTIDFKSAYLQGEDLDREIFLIPPKEANTNKLWQLNKCVYGISDAGRKWYNQLRKDILNLGAEVSKLDQQSSI